MNGTLINNKKRNMQFALLEVIAIVAVVAGHYGGTNFLKDWFPIYQWHMPMFLLISGYFYTVEQEQKLGKSLWKKTKHLFIPSICWNFIYCAISYILVNNSIIDFGQKYTFEIIFFRPFWDGAQWGINMPAWFALSLFLIQVVYVLTRKLLSYIKIKNEYILFIFFLMLGIIGVKLTYMGYREKWYLTITKVMFGIAFYSMGYLYKSKMEIIMNKIKNIPYFIVVLLLQYYIFVIADIPVKLSMWKGIYNEMEGHCYTPFITALPAIYFWIRIAKILTPAFENSKIINRLSENTFSIMMHHQFVAFCLNFLLLKINSIKALDGVRV